MCSIFLPLQSNLTKSLLCSLMSRVLAIRPKVRGFKPGRGDGYLRPIKIRSTHYFGGEVKPEVPCCKISQHVKKSLASMNKHTSQSQMHHSLRPFLLLATRWLCWQDCQRALVDESGIFLCRDHSTMAIHAHVSPGGTNNRAVRGCSSET
jgi:hypothetical protein